MNSKPLFFNENNNQVKKIDAFAEIVASSLESFTAQCWEWHYQPRFASLVRVASQHGVLFGLVTQIQTGSSDPMRLPVAYKKTEEELRAEQPQIFEFLTTTFEVQVLGYVAKNAADVVYALPPYPPKIHTFVEAASEEETNNFFSQSSFLHLLFAFQAKIINLDEILLAVIQQRIDSSAFTKEFFNNFYETYSLLNGNDYRRSKLFLQRVTALMRASSLEL